MRPRYFAVGLLVLSGILVACNSNSTTSTYTPPNPSPTATPVERPTQSGAILNYTGTASELNKYTYPRPHPQPSTLVTLTIAKTVTVSAGAAAGSSDFKSVEADSTSLQTTTTTTNDNYTEAANGSFTDFLLTGSTASDDQNNKFSTSWTKPLIIDQLPETAGTKWTNDPARTVTEDDADGNTYDRVYASDGSYVENDVLYGYNGAGNFPTVNVSYVDDAAGAGTFTVIRNYGGNLNPKAYEQLVDIVSYGAPTSGKISVGYTQYTVPSPPASPPPPPTPTPVLDVPAWFGGGPLFSDSNEVRRTAATIPTSCKVPGTFGNTANVVSHNWTSIDAVLGSMDTSSIDEYVVAGYGAVCVKLNDKSLVYYDYNNDWFDPNYVPNLPPGALSPLLGFATTKAPLQTTVWNETLTLQSVAYASGDARSKKSHGAKPTVMGGGIPPAAIADARVSLERWKMHEHAKQLNALMQRIQRSNLHGGSVK